MTRKELKVVKVSPENHRWLMSRTGEHQVRTGQSTSIDKWITHLRKHCTITIKE